ncbi:MAG TPA: hypothetical protein VN833_27995, partial [Candidatus Acidoferrales bacterium]|nr:hypothetical protein [Candidatus Acidoferrales bacterium]
FGGGQGFAAAVLLLVASDGAVCAFPEPGFLAPLAVAALGLPLSAGPDVAGESEQFGTLSFLRCLFFLADGLAGLGEFRGWSVGEAGPGFEPCAGAVWDCGVAALF